MKLDLGVLVSVGRLRMVRGMGMGAFLDDVHTASSGQLPRSSVRGETKSVLKTVVDLLEALEERLEEVDAVGQVDRAHDFATTAIWFSREREHERV